MQSEAEEPRITVHASSDRHANKVCLQVWIGSPGDCSGICTTAHLTTANAEKLLKRLREAIDELPREASADDLGIAA